mgnify:CR=1 FL=1|tara:strand:- start:216 stop:1334 length:1119 start_codon:yes stop_codon:yes gene_type:complete
MLKVGITGQNGFVGAHLYNSLKLLKNEYIIIDYNIDYFKNNNKLDEFVTKCDIIFHLAAMNRHNDQNIIYETNMNLVNKLISSLKRTKSKPHIIFSSSTQEENKNAYGKSKKDGRLLLQKWAFENGGEFTGLIIPNVFGPFGDPYYNSVIATFSHQISRGEETTINVDAKLNLIYVGELVQELIKKAKRKSCGSLFKVPHTSVAKVSEILSLLNKYKLKYQENGEIPDFNNNFELNLFNTYRCYIDVKSHFPVKLTKNTDVRGSFVEILKLGIGGQVSFSTTLPGVTRGNHFHTRKIERFAVIKGRALIQLRRIGTEEIIEFYLDGDEPAFVDMPIWYTHNIKNIGNEVLYTNFWINEFYDANDTDTYFEEV